MAWILAFFKVLFGYLVFIFVIIRAFVPFLGFKKYAPPENLPDEVKQKIHELENQSPNVRAYLQAAYDFVQSRWWSERLKTVTNFRLMFRTDIGEIWQQPGYAHCQTVNFILYTLLARSKFFSPDDIRLRHTFFNGVIHQYLKVKVDGKWVDADPSTKYLRLPLGQRSKFLG